MNPVERIVLQPWMEEPPTRKVMAALRAAGSPARFVGGSVRDALLGRPVLDIDIATPEPPDRVMALLAAAGIKTVPTGLAHGTVTAVVKPRHFEVTTLRRDVETDGRHATVAFTDDWAADASRRDFTMNALFLDSEGRIYDPLGGLPDLRAGYVRFVGDPASRIREDVLRILRFYRFLARYGKGEPDRAARAACRALANLLPTLSAERVATEFLKLLGVPDPLPVLGIMAEDGVLPILLPEATNLPRLAALLPLEPEADPLRRLGALLRGDGEAVGRRLKLSNDQVDRLAALSDPPWPVDPVGDASAQRRALHHLGPQRYGDLLLLRISETGEKGRLESLFAAAGAWKPRVFPLRGADLLEAGLPPGPEMGGLLAAIEAWWEENDFQPDRAACLARLAEIQGQA